MIKKIKYTLNGSAPLSTSHKFCSITQFAWNILILPETHLPMSFQHFIGNETTWICSHTDKLDQVHLFYYQWLISYDGMVWWPIIRGASGPHYSDEINLHRTLGTRKEETNKPMQCGNAHYFTHNLWNLSLHCNQRLVYFWIYLARALSILEIPYQVLNENFKTHKMKTSERKSGEYKTGCCHFLEMISMLTVWGLHLAIN